MPFNSNPSKITTHIEYLSKEIGGRGSCTPSERKASEYVLSQMNRIGVQAARLEPFRGAPSTYLPFGMAFGAALLGSWMVWVIPNRISFLSGAVLSAAGAWGMLAETDLRQSWMRRLLPKSGSQNAVGVIRPVKDARKRVVLCAHVDSHRTPIFYSSKIWQKGFGALTVVGFLSMVVAAGAYGVGAIWNLFLLQWVGAAGAILQLLALFLTLSAEFTPYSPGANDNASAVQAALDLAEKLVDERLSHTEVWLAFTGCEETGADGMKAFLDAHAAELGEDAVYFVLEQVGKGEMAYITADGLILKHPVNERAVELARRAGQALPEVDIRGELGIAYTDGTVVSKRGLTALILVSIPKPGESSHWHQMSDILENIDIETLKAAEHYSWQVLREIERSIS